MSLSIGPCELDDLAAACAYARANGRPSDWCAFNVQRRAGPCWAIWDEAGRTVAVGGLDPQLYGMEIWFAPTELFRENLLPALGLLRLTLQSFPYRGVIGALVSTPAGSAIARLCGGRRVSEPGSAREVWLWEER